MSVSQFDNLQDKASTTLKVAHTIGDGQLRVWDASRFAIPNRVVCYSGTSPYTEQVFAVLVLSAVDTVNNILSVSGPDTSYSDVALGVNTRIEIRGLAEHYNAHSAAINALQEGGGGGGSGSVTSVALAVPSGLAVTGSPVTTSGTITITTALNGLVKGTGTGFATAVAGTDFVVPSGNITGTASTITGSISEGQVTNLTTDLASKATDSTVLHLASSETVTGAKTFTQMIGGSISGNAATATTAGNVTGTVGIANGGTGQTTATNAINALVPAQSGQSGKVLGTDGTHVAWVSQGDSSPLTNPASIPNCILWLDANDSSSVIQSGGSISQWSDKSGNGNNATATSNQPTYVTSVLNGQPIVRFNGSSSLYANISLSIPFTLIVIGNCVPNGDSNSLSGSSPNTFMEAKNLTTGNRVSTHWTHFAGIANTLVRLDGGTETSASYNSSKRAIEFYRRVDLVDAGSGRTYENSELRMTDANTLAFPNTATQIQIGSQYGGNFLLGDIAEFIIYDRIVTANEQAQVDAYLRNKWRI